MKIIGITGKARSGKDMAAMHILEQHGYSENAFATPLKKAIGAMFGLTDEQLYGDEKDVIIPWLGITPRELFQRLGGWARRELREDLLVIMMQRWLNTVPRFVPGVLFSDVRLEIEADFIRSRGGFLIHITRDAAPAVRDDETERGVEIRSGDLIVTNNGTLDELYAKLDDLLRVNWCSHG